MDCLICHKMFIKEIEFRNSPLPNPEIIVRSLCKLLEITNSSKVQEILKDPNICQNCYIKLKEADTRFREMEILQRKFGHFRLAFKEDLAHSKAVGEVMWKNMPEMMSKSSLDRLNLLKDIETDKGNCNKNFEDIPFGSSGGGNNSWNSCQNLITAFSSQSQCEFPIIKEEIVEPKPKLKICLKRIQLPPGVSTFKINGESIIAPKKSKITKMKYPNKPTQCEVCLKSFKNSSHLKYHKFSHMEESQLPFRCPHCNRGFAFKVKLDLHYGDGMPAKCQSCKESFKSIGCLKQHNFIVHGISYMRANRNRIKAINQARSIFKCGKCTQTFSSKGNLMTHLLIHDEGLPKYKCPIGGCGKMFTARYMKNHVAFVHNKRRDYECKFQDCGKWFTSNMTRKYHYQKIHFQSINL